jgi:BlaI family penicillinase repressor
MPHTPPDLGDLELEAMQLIWTQGPMTAEIVRERLQRTLKESTVRTVLRRLEEKGYLSHTVEQRTFTFHATEARQHVAAKAVKRIVDWFCNGSMEEVLVGMVDSDMLDDKQLRALAARIEQAKKEQGQ